MVDKIISGKTKVQTSKQEDFEKDLEVWQKQYREQCLRSELNRIKIKDHSFKTVVNSIVRNRSVDSSSLTLNPKEERRMGRDFKLPHVDCKCSSISLDTDTSNKSFGKSSAQIPASLPSVGLFITQNSAESSMGSFQEIRKKSNEIKKFRKENSKKLNKKIKMMLDQDEQDRIRKEQKKEQEKLDRR